MRKGGNVINILFFIESLSGGGAEKVLRNLVNAMDQTKFCITVQMMRENISRRGFVTGIAIRRRIASTSFGCAPKRRLD